MTESVNFKSESLGKFDINLILSATNMLEEIKLFFISATAKASRVFCYTTLDACASFVDKSDAKKQEAYISETLKAVFNVAQARDDALVWRFCDYLLQSENFKVLMEVYNQGTEIRKSDIVKAAWKASLDTTFEVVIKEVFGLDYATVLVVLDTLQKFRSTVYAAHMVSETVLVFIPDYIDLLEEKQGIDVATLKSIRKMLGV